MRKKISNAILVWGRFGSFVLLEKILTAPFFYGYFPFVINHMGAVDGFIQNFVTLILLSLLVWAAYDKVGMDLVGTVELKARLAEKGEKFRTKLHIEKRESGVLHMIGRLIEFLLCVWQFSPPLALLIYRKDGKIGKRETEMLELALMSLLSTVWWTLYSVGVLQISMVKDILNCARRLVGL